MKQVIAALISALVILLLPVSAQESVEHPALESFEFLGCSGDFEGQDATPEIWRLTANGKVSFLTHTVAACGLSGRAPAVMGGTDTLDLSYELYSPTDVVIMCECEYWARFTFGQEAHAVKSVTFSGKQAVLRGSWPGR